MKELRYLDRYLYKYRYHLLFGVLIAIASKRLAGEIPEVIKNSINLVSDFHDESFTDTKEKIDFIKKELHYNTFIIIGLSILSGGFTFLMRQTIIVTSRRIEFDLKNKVYKQYQRLNLEFYKKNRTGDLMNRINEDIGKVRMYLGPGIMYSINMLVIFFVAIYKMIQIDIILTLYTLIPFPLLSLLILLLSRFTKKKSQSVQRKLSELTTMTQEFFSGINVIKSYAIEDMTKNKIREIIVESKKQNVDLFKIQAFFFPMMVLLIGISNIIVLYVGGMQYIAGTINIGIIAEFIMYTNMLTWPVTLIGWVTSTVQQAEASQKRINEFLKKEAYIKSASNLCHPINGEISFDRISLTYPENNIEALKNISFQIEPLKIVAIVGKIGSGKSSILNLIVRLYNPTSGNIKIDGIPIEQYNLSNLRDQIGFVPQDPFLFSDTIENNIRFGNESAKKDAIIHSAKKACIHDEIMDFKHQYNTVLGERGLTLSGGQKQRISIARAIVKTSKIYIFDDPLSSVDTKTETQIWNTIKSLNKESTIFLISHKISIAKYADKIIVLDEGQIVQEGNHDDLLKTNNLYEKMYRQQLEKN